MGRRSVSQPKAPRDFAFVQMTDPRSRRRLASALHRLLYVSFTNASAFSPTDTMPLTRWAKLLMMLQSVISILTLLLVAARAVNILTRWRGATSPRRGARRSAPKKDRIRPMIERLAVEHADAQIALTFPSPLELLVSVMLSAQTTDVNVNRVTEKLFVKYQRPEDYLAVPVEELERDIFQTGFYRQKAKSLRGTMQILIEEHGGEVPEDFDELLRLPGVARKTANVVSAERGNAAGDRRRHARAPALAAARPDEAGGPGEDRARPDQARPARGLGALPAPADLARPPRLRRAQAALRGLPARSGPLPVEPGLGGRNPRWIRRTGLGSRCWSRVSGRQRDEQAAVVVVGGEEVGDDLLLDAAARADRELLAEPAHAPFARELDRLRVGEAAGLDDVAAHQVGSSGKPVSSKMPRPIASTRRSWSQTRKPVSGAG